MKYRKKPQYIEAMQFTRTNWDEVSKFTEMKAQGPMMDCLTGGKLTCFVPTEIGTQLVLENDYIIKNGDGFFTVYRPDIFEQTFEVAT